MSESVSNQQPTAMPAPLAALPGLANVPAGLVASVVDLVATGPVMLGAYTLAELVAVDAVVDFLEEVPSQEALAEAVRSLAARQLLVAGDAEGQVEVRGDLGIAVAFQQRADRVLDARLKGSVPGEPWRVLVLPQPEPIVLVVQIDAIGVHEIGLYPAADAVERLVAWLPQGSLSSDLPADTAAAVADADRSALLTVTTFTSSGSAEQATSSTDTVLVTRGDDLLVLARSAPGDQLAAPVPPPTGLKGLVAELLGVAAP